MAGKIVTEVKINRTAEEAFDFATTPANWPQWHPSSQGVSGTVDHPLEVGESVTEAVSVAGLKDSATWTVVERERPNKWKIQGVSSKGSAVIVYSFTPESGGARFTRELEYSLSNPLLSLLDPLLIRRRMKAASEQALASLKKVLET